MIIEPYRDLGIIISHDCKSCLNHNRCHPVIHSDDDYWMDTKCSGGKWKTIEEQADLIDKDYAKREYERYMEDKQTLIDFPHLSPGLVIHLPLCTYDFIIVNNELFPASGRPDLRKYILKQNKIRFLEE